MYYTGGLETKSNYKTVTLGGTDYVLTDRFKTLLRDSFIDWGTFLEVYHDLKTKDLIYQIAHLLDINVSSDDTDDLRIMMLPCLEQIHKLPARAHIACMLKQFMIYEPVSIAIQSLFSLIKFHWESIIKTFVRVRNAYIESNKLKKINKLNDWDSLIDSWNDAHNTYELNSSSIILLMINAPIKLKSKLHYNVDGISEIKPLIKSIKKFKYLGFCPYEPRKRLIALLEFPINEFTAAITAMDKTVNLPNYNLAEAHINKIIGDSAFIPPNIPTVRHKPVPSHLSSDTTEETIKLTKWYVRAILDYRKSLIKTGQEYEKYYINIAKQLNTIYITLKRDLTDYE